MGSKVGERYRSQLSVLGFLLEQLGHGVCEDGYKNIKGFYVLSWAD